MNLNLNVFIHNLTNAAKDETYAVNLDKYKSIITHWIALYINGNEATCFDSFCVDNIPKEIKEFISLLSIEIT